MTNGPTLPPQAYTREVLTIAFNWLQNQPESIKKLAQTPDALVGLYLRAQRFGDRTAESDAPVSSQAFISDLKNLAEGLKEFDDAKDSSNGTQRLETTSQNAPVPSAMATAKQPPSDHQIHTQIQNSLNSRSAGNWDINESASHTKSVHGNLHVAQSQSLEPDSILHGSKELIQTLSPASQTMIQEVKHSLNLSSDLEALNMLVAIAYKNVKTLLA